MEYEQKYFKIIKELQFKPGQEITPLKKLPDRNQFKNYFKESLTGLRGFNYIRDITKQPDVDFFVKFITDYLQENRQIFSHLEKIYVGIFSDWGGKEVFEPAVTIKFCYLGEWKRSADYFTTIALTPFAVYEIMPYERGRVYNRDLSRAWRVHLAELYGEKYCKPAREFVNDLSYQNSNLIKAKLDNTCNELNQNTINWREDLNDLSKKQ